MKILTVVGARPQFIKASAFSRQIAQNDDVEEILLHTGQHYDFSMSDIFFEQLDIAQPKYNLDIGNLPHGAMTGRQLEEIEKILLDEKPDCLLVYGDTNSTLAGALAATKLHIPVAHVEAGLRSFNKKMPEEINRILTDHVSNWLFVPTNTATINLKNEGIQDKRVHLVGDVMYDVALFFGQKAKTQSHILDELQLADSSFVVATIHRSESTDNEQRLRDIFSSLFRLSKEIKLVLPIHPRTKKTLEKANLLEEVERHITVIPPVGYLDMTQLIQNSELVITDSGGLQKEAFFHDVPCVTLRDETEWVELVELGVNRLPDSFQPEALLEDFKQMMQQKQQGCINPYGDGNASQKILDVLKRS